jgi:hypothetical protein
MQVRNLALGVVARGVDWKKLGFVGTTDSEFSNTGLRSGSESQYLYYHIIVAFPNRVDWKKLGLSLEQQTVYFPTSGSPNDDSPVIVFVAILHPIPWKTLAFVGASDSQFAEYSVEARPSVVPFVVTLL